MILGIDPGAKTGVAIYREGCLQVLETTDTLAVCGMIKATKPKLVVIEDSTVQSFVFTAPGVRHAAALKVARNIGEIDGYCKLIKQACAELKIECRSVSPKGKGQKLDAARFKILTGWPEASNQHERDAAMVAWRFRSTR